MESRGRIMDVQRYFALGNKTFKRTITLNKSSLAYFVSITYILITTDLLRTPTNGQNAREFIIYIIYSVYDGLTIYHTFYTVDGNDPLTSCSTGQKFFFLTSK